MFFCYPYPGWYSSSDILSSTTWRWTMSFAELDDSRRSQWRLLSTTTHVPGFHHGRRTYKFCWALLICFCFSLCMLYACAFDVLDTEGNFFDSDYLLWVTFFLFRFCFCCSQDWWHRIWNTLCRHTSGLWGCLHSMSSHPSVPQLYVLAGHPKSSGNFPSFFRTWPPALRTVLLSVMLVVVVVFRLYASG